MANRRGTGCRGGGGGRLDWRPHLPQVVHCQRGSKRGRLGLENFRTVPRRGAGMTNCRGVQLPRLPRCCCCGGGIRSGSHKQQARERVGSGSQRRWRLLGACHAAEDPAAGGAGRGRRAGTDAEKTGGERPSWPIHLLAAVHLLAVPYAPFARHPSRLGCRAIALRHCAPPARSVPPLRPARQHPSGRCAAQLRPPAARSVRPRPLRHGRGIT
jgi:hypothetical protein